MAGSKSFARRLAAFREQYEKPALGVALASLALLVLFRLSHWLWWLAPARTLEVVVVNKTVAFEDYRGHQNLAWLLRTLKWTQRDGRFLDPARDYLGFDPRTRSGTLLAPHHLARAGLLFIADTYGVYEGDYASEEEVAALERSPKIFGGLQASEVDAIESFGVRGGRVVAEFNTFASPTEPAERARLERLFGARWTEWIARYWPNLQDDNEVPKWLGRLYQKVHGRPFDLTGPGLVFVRGDADIVVLRPEEHLFPDVLRLERGADAEDWLPGGARYMFWLDVVEAVDAEVLYEYRVQVNGPGRAVLAAHGLKPRFPALLHRKSGADAWYFAGDFIDLSLELGDPERLGLIEYRRLLTWVTDRPFSDFFWRWYAPVWTALLEGARVPRPSAHESATGVEQRR